MTVTVKIHPSHVFRTHLIRNALRYEGLRKIKFPCEGIIVGEITQEDLAKIPTIVGIESIESVPPRATSTLSYSV